MRMTDFKGALGTAVPLPTLQQDAMMFPMAQPRSPELPGELGKLVEQLKQLNPEERSRVIDAAQRRDNGGAASGRWDLQRLAATSAQDADLAAAGLEDWAAELDREDRG